MFGVTTACVQQVVPLLEPDYDCLVFHATGTGGSPWKNCWTAICCPACWT